MIPQPDVRPIGARWYALMEDYTASWEENGALFSLTVPMGFNTDLASIPRPLWTLTGLLPDGLVRAAALIHDYIYRFRGQMPIGSYKVWAYGEWVASLRPIPRDVADTVFKNLSTKAGVHPNVATVMWVGVRAFGWIPWMKSKPEIAGGTIELDG